ncbi:MAG: lipopolysaccharide biosynthesis protein [Actinomycetota bacterium]
MNDPVATGSAFARLRGRLVGDAIVYALAKAVANAGSFALVVLLSRTLVPSELGLYSVMLGAVGLSSLVWSGWFSAAAFRYSAEYRVAGTLWRMRATAVRAYLLMGVALAAVVTVAWAVGVPWIGDLRAPLATYWILLLAVSSPASSIPELYRAEGRSIPSALLTVTLAIAPIGGILLFAAVSSVDLVVVLAAQALVSLVVFSTAGMAWGSRPAFPPDEARDMVRRFFRYGWPLVASNVSAWVLSLADRYIIALVDTAEQVGYYTVGYQLASAPLLFIYGAVALPFEPLALSAHADGDRDKAFELVGKGVALTLAAEVLALILLLGAREELISTFIGDDFSRAVDVIPMIAVGTALFCVALARQQVAVLSEDTRFIFRALLSVAVFNVALNVVLIPAISIEGAAWATAVAYTVYALLMFLRGDRRRARMPSGWPLQILFSGIVAFGMFAIADHYGPDGWGGFALSGVTASIVYIGGLAARGEASVVYAVRQMIRRR